MATPPKAEEFVRSDLLTTLHSPSKESVETWARICALPENAGEKLVHITGLCPQDVVLPQGVEFVRQSDGSVVMSWMGEY